MSRKLKINIDIYNKLIYEESLPFKEVAKIMGVAISSLTSFRYRNNLPNRGWAKGIHPMAGSKMPKELKERLSKISSERTGEKNSRWCGDKRTNYQGYILIRKPEHPFADCNGWVREHRLIVEKHLGRILDRSENVHHLNCIKSDNRLENLVVCTNSEHHRLYHLDTAISNLEKAGSHIARNKKVK